jgi:hypothetical protein
MTQRPRFRDRLHAKQQEIVQRGSQTTSEQFVRPASPAAGAGSPSGVRPDPRVSAPTSLREVLSEHSVAFVTSLYAWRRAKTERYVMRRRIERYVTTLPPRELLRAKPVGELPGIDALVTRPPVRTAGSIQTPRPVSDTGRAERPSPSAPAVALPTDRDSEDEVPSTATPSRWLPATRPGAQVRDARRTRPAAPAPREPDVTITAPTPAFGSDEPPALTDAVPTAAEPVLPADSARNFDEDASRTAASLESLIPRISAGDGPPEPPAPGRQAPEAPAASEPSAAPAPPVTPEPHTADVTSEVVQPEVTLAPLGRRLGWRGRGIRPADDAADSAQNSGGDAPMAATSSTPKTSLDDVPPEPPAPGAHGHESPAASEPLAAPERPAGPEAPELPKADVMPDVVQPGVTSAPLGRRSGSRRAVTKRGDDAETADESVPQPAVASEPVNGLAQTEQVTPTELASRRCPGEAAAAAVPRLRQTVLAVRDLESTVARLREEFGLGEPYRDPAVVYFGLANAVFALGDTFLELISPVSPQEPGARAATRQLERSAGVACGYMAKLQVDGSCRGPGAREHGEHPRGVRRRSERHCRGASACRRHARSSRDVECSTAGRVVAVGRRGVEPRWRSRRRDRNHDRG